MARRPVDPEEELRWMSQEVRGYVEAVLNSLAANVPKVISFLAWLTAGKLINKLFPVAFLFWFLPIFLLCTGCCSLSSGESQGRHAEPVIQFSKVSMIILGHLLICFVFLWEEVDGAVLWEAFLAIHCLSCLTLVSAPPFQVLSDE